MSAPAIESRAKNAQSDKNAQSAKPAQSAKNGQAKPLSHLAQRNRNLWYGAKATTEILLWTAATPIAILLRYDGAIPESAINGLLTATFIALALKAAAVHLFGLHTQSWHRTSANDARTLGVAIAAVTAILFVTNLLTPHAPRSVPLIDGAISFGALFLLRAVTREFVTRSYPPQLLQKDAQRVLIVGAGEAGALVAKELQRHPSTGLTPIGFVDDDPTLSRLNINGTKVLGTTDDLPKLIDKHQAHQVLIAVPSAEGAFIRKILGLIEKAKLNPQHRIVPGVYELLSGDVNISRIREVKIEDLLRRPPVRLDLQTIADYVDGETVLITGAGGSIGSEITRQLCAFKPKRLILLGRGENSIYEIAGELNSTPNAPKRTTVIANVVDENRMRQVFEQHKPTVVFHAAAHKHVPFMEENPGEAVINNVLGTRTVATLAHEFGVKRFVNVSTDKAVNPSSVMGASKRLAEDIVRELSQRSTPDQHFVTVRFGNVLGSRGSVVPHFLNQIRAMKPVTITHPEMTRYFMTIPEASQLVLQAGGLGQNGAIYMLEMGEPVKIVDLAYDVIRLAGFEPERDIPIVYTGIRPGEKIHEELMTEAEKSAATSHEKISVASPSWVDPQQLKKDLDVIQKLAREADPEATTAELFRIVGGKGKGTTGTSKDSIVA